MRKHLRKRNCEMKKMYDFSVAMGIVTLLAYALLLFLFGFTWFVSGNAAIYGTVFVLLCLSFLFVIWYFVIMAPRLEKDGIHRGAFFIPKNKLQYKVIYNLRFRETQIRLRSSDVEYRGMPNKLKKKKELYVQATDGNLRKLGEWFGCEIVIPDDARSPRKRRRIEKKRNGKKS